MSFKFYLSTFNSYMCSENEVFKPYRVPSTLRVNEPFGDSLDLLGSPGGLRLCEVSARVTRFWDPFWPGESMALESVTLHGLSDDQDGVPPTSDGLQPKSHVHACCQFI